MKVLKQSFSHCCLAALQWFLYTVTEYACIVSLCSLPPLQPRASHVFVCLFLTSGSNTHTYLTPQVQRLSHRKNTMDFFFFFWPLPFLPDWSGSSRFWWISLITLFIFTSIKNLETDTLHDDLWTIIIPVNKGTAFPSLSRILSFQQWRYFFKRNWKVFFCFRQTFKRSEKWWNKDDHTFIYEAAGLRTVYL